MKVEKDQPIKIGELLRSKGLWLATAESCTGGLLGHLITATAGSSDYYLGGFITYSNETKERWLGVAHATLVQFGAVSRETVQEMARGVRNAFGEKIRSRKDHWYFHLRRSQDQAAVLRKNRWVRFGSVSAAPMEKKQ